MVAVEDESFILKTYSPRTDFEMKVREWNCFKVHGTSMNTAVRIYGYSHFTDIPTCYFLKQLQENSPALSWEQVWGIITTVENTCSHCFNSSSDCQCWNDL